MVDLTVSELCDLAIAEKNGALAWGDSAQRNARLIGNIFIAVNGNLHMSQIEQRHLLAVRAHLDIMPAVWGKSAADKEGGFPAVFERGKSLAAIWKTNPVAAKINNTAKVGLEVPTFNRHIRTLFEVTSRPQEVWRVPQAFYGEGRHRVRARRLPLFKMLQAVHLMVSSKKCISAHQLTGCLKSSRRARGSSPTVSAKLYAFGRSGAALRQQRRRGGDR